MTEFLNALPMVFLSIACLSAFAYLLTMTMTGGTGEDRLARENFKKRNRRVTKYGYELLNSFYIGKADTIALEVYAERLDKEIKRTKKRIARYGGGVATNIFVREIEYDLRDLERARESLAWELEKEESE